MIEHISADQSELETGMESTMTRPMIFNNDLGRSIASRMAAGEPLISICGDDGMPPFAVAMDWLNDPKDRRFGILVRDALDRRLATALAIDGDAR
jgi:hypothetical protein